MSKKVLLLNSVYQGLSFISLRRAIKLLVKERAELISSWDEKIHFGSGAFPYPSIIRLTRYIPRHIKKHKFNRAGVLKRDKLTCQYCGRKCQYKELTIDHVFPKILGRQKGWAHNEINSWENCVACCRDCNNRKGERTLKQARMKLLHKPYAPQRTIWHEYQLINKKHPDWADYIVG